jgi:hypothetical protein
MKSKYVTIGLAWLALATAMGVSGVTRDMRAPTPQLVLAGLTAALVLGYRRVRGFRNWLDGLTLRSILALHLTRFVGFYFLVLHSRGELPYAFAVPGGWGDIAVATSALLVMAATPDFATRRPLIYAWNTLGLLDILMVVATATRLFLADAASMGALLRFPLSLRNTRR